MKPLSNRPHLLGLWPLAEPADRQELRATNLRALYERHTPFLRSALARLAGPGVDVDDLLQEVFVVALRRPEKLETAQSPRAWLYCVAVHLAKRARRKARLRRCFGLSAAQDVASGQSPLEDVARTQVRGLIQAVLDRLSERRRTTFILFELEGLKGEEIAAIEGCSVNTVWTRLHHARRDFAAHLSALEPGWKEGGP